MPATSSTPTAATIQARCLVAMFGSVLPRQCHPIATILADKRGHAYLTDESRACRTGTEEPGSLRVRGDASSVLLRVYRSGSFRHPAYFARSAFRTGAVPQTRYLLGLRPSRVITE